MQILVTLLLQTFTSGKISAIETNSGAQYRNRMGHGGSQRRVAFENTAFSRDPSLWEVNGEYTFSVLGRVHIVTQKKCYSYYKLINVLQKYN